MKTFKQFRNGEGNLRKRPPKRRGKQDNGYLPPQIQSLQGEKDTVLVEALLTYYQAQEATRWRQTRPPSA